MRRNLSRILTFLILFTYLKPFNASLVEPINRLYGILKIGATLLLLLCIFHDRASFTKGSLAGMLLAAIWMVSVLLNNRGFGGRLQELLSILGISLLIAYLRPTEGGLSWMARLLHHFAAVYILLQFVTVVLDRPLIGRVVVSYDKYFLGGDNYSAFILIPLAGFLFSWELERYGTIRPIGWVLGGLGFLSLLIPFAVAGMAAYGIFLVLVLLRCYPQVRKLASLRNALLLSCLLTGIMIITYTGQHLQISIMGKLGLNSREIIWPKAFGAFLQKPLLGYGSLTQAQVDSYMLYGMGHAHNIVMEFLMFTGIAGTGTLIYLVYRLLKQGKKTRSRSADCLLLCMAAYALCGIFDFYIGSIYFWLLLFFTDAWQEKCLQEPEHLYS